MFAEDGALAEGLPTNAAHVGLLSGVGSLMLQQMGAPAKAFPTLGAPVGSLTTGNSLMLRERHTLAQDLGFRPADGTWTHTEALITFITSLINPSCGCFPQNH